MNPNILEYIRGQRVGVLAIEMLDGSPHGATVHFAHTENPLIFLFETARGYKKTEALLGRETSRATLVIGSDESSMKTLQLDGVVQVVPKEDFEEVYLGKFPEKREKSLNNPDVIFFTFTPLWWRFTDWETPAGKVVIENNTRV